MEVLLKVIQRIYDKSPEKQEMIDVSLTEVCAEGDISHKQDFFYFVFSLLLSLS